MAKNSPQQTANTISLPDLAKNLFARLRSIGFARWYSWFAVMVLAGTTTAWAWLGASLQQSNADQLASSYLFENSHTFNGAEFPGSHSFLFKWPLFWIAKLFHYSDWIFTALTIVSVLAAVLALAFVINRIERRPAMFGTICLALASVLLLVPAQPYAGGLLPLNMAMLTTRNLEYGLYIAALSFFARAGGWRTWRFWISAGLLGLLAASDKLFISISVVGALLALVAYSLRRTWDYVNLASAWLVCSLAGGAISIAALAIVNAAGLTNITATASPYHVVTVGKDLALGVVYLAMGLATNFGANPAYDATIVRRIPGQLYHGIAGIAGPSLIVNFFVLLAGAGAAYYLIRSSWAPRKKRLILDQYSALGLALSWSAIASAVLFVVSSHYYAVDSRYLTIVVFSCFAAMAIYTRTRNWPGKRMYMLGAIFCVSISLGFVSMLQTNNKQSTAIDSVRNRNSLVAQALKNHPVSFLAGDYWRVLPIRQASKNTIKVRPLDDCFTPRRTLSSQAWQSTLKNQRFAYLLSLDSGLSDFPHCKLDQVLRSYGQPNSSILIDGSFAKPKELLLIYEHGPRPSFSSSANRHTSILPIDLADLGSTSCAGPTVMNIVAHQDDDLLFTSPDLLHTIKNKHCVRTIYLTAGDSGGSRYYWLARHQGSEAAYSNMLGVEDSWIEKTVKISDNEFITVASPKSNNSISLIFVNLPDGGLWGNGFGHNGFESLQKLYNGGITSIHTVDGQSIYTSETLVAMLTKLMHVYQPSEIRTQTNNGAQGALPDHSDHINTGAFARLAYAQYETQQFENQIVIPIKFYLGYQIHQLPENVTDGDLQGKEAAFFQYAIFDNAVCRNIEQCNRTSNYGFYLARQYQGQ